MVVAPSFLFSRPEVASRVAHWALGEDPFSPGEVTVFLAAPRQTGKSTFLTHDLLPELTARGATPVYVNLWSQPSDDPSLLINEVVRTALGKFGVRGGATLAVVGQFEI